MRSGQSGTLTGRLYRAQMPVKRAARATMTTRLSPILREDIEMKPGSGCFAEHGRRMLPAPPGVQAPGRRVCCKFSPACATSRKNAGDAAAAAL